MAKRPERDPAKHSKKDPAKPTRAKASRPDVPALDPALAELLNPGIGQGTAGLGSQTGLKPPPDNSWDRRADFANAHKARKSTQGKTVQQGFGERPQAGYVAKGPADIDPELADALGYGGQRSEQAADRRAAARARRDCRNFRAAARETPPPVAAADDARRHRLDAGAGEIVARGPRGIPRVSKCGRRTGRRGRKNPKAAAVWSSSPNSIRRAISRRRSPNWSKACGATTAPRCCSASPARARPSPWRR